MIYRKMTLEQRVGAEVFARAGLAALSPQQQRVLADWLERYTQEIVAAAKEACRRRGAPTRSLSLAARGLAPQNQAIP